MNFVEQFMTRNPHYRNQTKFRPRGISVISIHKAQPSAKVLISNQNNEKCRSICPHAIIDHTGTVYHTLPWNAKSPNSVDNIVVLLCEPGDIKYEKNGSRTIGNLERAVLVEERIYQSAVELCGQLCYQKGMDPNMAIQLPANANEDASELWNALGMNRTADDFRNDIARVYLTIMEENRKAKKNQEKIEADDGVAEAPVPQMSMPETVSHYMTCAPQPEPEKQTWQVRIDVDRLRIRSSPEVKPNNVTGKYTGKGIFTITEIQNGSGSTKGWGRLESGGWISLDHVVML